MSLYNVSEILYSLEEIIGKCVTIVTWNSNVCITVIGMIPVYPDNLIFLVIINKI